MALNDPTTPQWWRHAVCYQVYVRSFADSDGDGVGDLPGITSRLPYLRDLGVDALWITPFYTSPQHDHGYDVADYCDVDPLFGSLADADDAARARPRARAAGDRRHRPQPHLRRARLVPGGAGRGAGQPGARRATCSATPTRPTPSCRPTTGSPSSAAPPGRRSTDGQWYLHLFDPTQPDLDWRNPEVGDMFEDVLRFWLDRGVDGFRIDVAHGLFKEAGLRDQVVRRRRAAEPAGRGHRWSSATSRRRADVGPARGARRLPPLAQGPRRVRRRPDGRRRGLDPDPRVDGGATSAPTSCTRRSTSRGCSPTWSAAAFAEVITGTLDGRRAGRRLPDLGAQQPRRRPPRDAVRRRRARPGPRPGGDADDAGAARARRTSTRARSSAWSRSTSRRSSGRTRPGSAPARTAATAAGCRSRGAARGRRTASGRAPTSPGSRSPTTGRRSPSRPSWPTRTRRWRSTARRWPRGAVRRRPRATTVELLELGDGRARVPARPAHGRRSTAATKPVPLPDGRGASSPAARSTGRQAARRTPRSGSPAEPVRSSERGVVAAQRRSRTPPGRPRTSRRGARRGTCRRCRLTSASRAGASSVRREQRRAAVGGVGRPLDQAEVDEVLDLPADRALVDAELSATAEDRTGPASARWLSSRYDAGCRSGWTARARSRITRRTRRISTPTSCSRSPSGSASCAWRVTIALASSAATSGASSSSRRIVVRSGTS